MKKWLPLRGALAAYFSRLNILLEKREGGRTKERERERDPKSELWARNSTKTRRYLTLSPTRSVFPHSSFRSSIRPSIRPSIHHRIPEHEHGTRNDRLHKTETKGSLPPSLSPSLDKNILSPIQTAKTLFGGPLLDLFLAFWKKKNKKILPSPPGVVLEPWGYLGS